VGGTADPRQSETTRSSVGKQQGIQHNKNHCSSERWGHRIARFAGEDRSKKVVVLVVVLVPEP